MADPRGGSPKTKGSGRKKGTPNKSSLPLQEKARKLGIDPFEILLMFAKGDWKGLGYDARTVMKVSMGRPYEEDVIQAEHRLKAAADACQYLYAKRKAIEIEKEPEPEKEMVFTLKWADESDSNNTEHAKANTSAKKNQ